MKKYATNAHGRLETSADGKTAVPGLPEKLMPHVGDSKGQMQFARLTSREVDVLQSVATGRLNKQAASELCISVKTVEKHREHLMKKLGIRGIAGLTHFAIYAGIVPCNPLIAMKQKTSNGRRCN